MSSIKSDLLMKAKRDLSKLVKVRRVVTRRGKTFTQDFYVLPSQVKPTDTVIGNQQNLLPAVNTIPKPASGVLDVAYFDKVALSDKNKALDYLRSCGITWNDKKADGTKVKDYVSWMRGKMALKAYLANPTTTQSVQNSSTQSNTQPTQPTLPTQQNSQPKQNINLQAIQDKLLKAKPELDACKNGKEKVVVLKKYLGQAGCIQYAESLGITWNKHDNPGINSMRMSMALKDYLDAQDGTTSPKGGGAPMGNQNAKKDTSAQATPTAKATPAPVKATADPDAIEAPANATQRQKNIVALINSITNPAELTKYTSVGMIPEDAVSKDYILGKLVPKYAVWSAAHMNNKVSKFTTNTAGDFGGKITETLKISGCNKNVISKGFSELYDDFNMANITHPRNQIASNLESSSARIGKTTNMFKLFVNLSDAFDAYTTDDYAEKDKIYGVRGEYLTNKGYDGCDPDIFAKRYDLEKEGFTRALRSIEEKYPQLKTKCDEMIKTYDEIMTICKGNPQLLKAVLYQDTWDDSSTDGVYQYYNLATDHVPIHQIDPRNAREIVKCVDKQYETFMKLFKERNMSDEEIEATLSSYWNDSLMNFAIKDKDGMMIDTVNVIDSVKDDSGEPMLNDDNLKRFGSGARACILSRFREEHNLNTDSKPHIAGYKAFKQMAEFSNADYLKVQDKVHKLFGIQFTRTDLNTGKTDTLELSKVDPSFAKTMKSICNVYDPVTEVDKDKDYIFSNLLMMNTEIDMNKRIIRNIEKNTSSKINDGGGDYSKNYNYYYPSAQQGSAFTRIKQRGNLYINFYSAKELNDKIDQQLADAITVSPDYIEKVTQYYTAKANYQDSLEEARRANFGEIGIDVNDYVDNPLKDILYKYSTSIIKNIPRMSEKGTDKLNQNIAKNLDYVPFDFESGVQYKLSDKNKKSTATKSQLKQLRQDLFKATHCTISVEPDDVSLQMRKDFLNNWDYHSGQSETTPDGFSHSERLYSGKNSFQGKDRRALFNSRFFRINNSNFEEDFNEYQTELKSDTSLTDKASEPIELYHACSYASAAGILGHDGAWFMGDQYTKVAKSLGNGAYFGYKGGKSSVYCGEGDGGYHNLSISGANRDNANGCYVLATVMRGKDNKDSKSDHGSFRDYEIAVKNNKCIKPHHFVDISARAVNVNINRDSQGNYIDVNTGKIAYDKYGKSVSMK